ncbi:hypothetical protein [Nonomuraea lactucae]|uniref:hypothetical protein n=1 Tax=Nonomuraea lactucae TaxID=2249762 RepID=UPI000DE47144|nr:hypothetical protein [Nonomuraea lactucae]
MPPTARRLAAGTLMTGGLLLLASPASHAVVDPVTTVTCLAGSTADLTGLVDPASPGVPSEVPGVNCLAP